MVFSTICSMTSSNSIVKAPTQKSFTNSLQLYNIQYNQVNKRINLLVLKLSNSNEKDKDDVYLELQKRIDDKRDIMNKKRDLYKSYNLYWDEEFF